LTRSVSIKEVAARAGVSVGTVSNVLNRTDGVRDDTRARVEAAITELHFVRNESARQLRAKQSRIVGVLVLDVTNPFFTDVARGAEEVLNSACLSVMLCNSDTDEARQNSYLQLLTEQRVQGILLVPVGRITQQVNQLRRHGIATVLLDSKTLGDTACSVSVDDVDGGRLAIQHLLEMGHRRIAFVGGKGRERQVADRAKGAHLALLNYRDSDSELLSLTVASLTISGGFDAATQVLDIPAEQRPTAAFCSNDLIALGMLRELHSRGVTVPDDFAIVGYDDTDYAGAATVPLSSVRQPARELGRVAAELLLDEASGNEHHHRQVVLETELVIRQSSATPLTCHHRRVRKR
jgi:LacI family transcriptional regulator